MLQEGKKKRKMEMKRVRVLFRVQLQTMLNLKSSLVTVNRISQPTIAEFSRHLHQQFDLSSVCDDIDIMVGNKRINPMQSTYYLEDNEVLTVCCKGDTLAGVDHDHASNKDLNLVEDKSCMPSILVTIDIDYEDFLLKHCLKEERVTVNVLECPRIRDVASLLMKQLHILDIDPEVEGLNLKIGSYVLSGEDTTHVMRNGDTVTVCIKKKDKTPLLNRMDRRKKRKRIMEILDESRDIREVQIGESSGAQQRGAQQRGSPPTAMADLEWHLGVH